MKKGREIFQPKQSGIYTESDSKIGIKRAPQAHKGVQDKKMN
jgi:hypothetical protein